MERHISTILGVVGGVAMLVRIVRPIERGRLLLGNTSVAVEENTVLTLPLGFFIMLVVGLLLCLSSLCLPLGLLLCLYVIHSRVIRLCGAMQYLHKASEGGRKIYVNYLLAIRLGAVVGKG